MQKRLNDQKYDTSPLNKRKEKKKKIFLPKMTLICETFSQTSQNL